MAEDATLSDRPPARRPSDMGSPHAWRSRGYLPHFDVPGLVRFITFRLHDSVPAEQVDRWKKELHWREDMTLSDPQSVQLRRRIDAYEDAGHGECYLRDARIAGVVDTALRHFDGDRYRLIEWSIMPNHVHVLIETAPGQELDRVVRSWKSFTAKTANCILNRKGPFWMREYFDRFIRDDKHYASIVRYIANQGPHAVFGSRVGNVGHSAVSK